MKRVYASIPLDLLNVVGGFIGDDYHYLTFDLTPKRRWLAPCRMFMQSRTNPRRKSRNFFYGGLVRNTQEDKERLIVVYGSGTRVREKRTHEEDHEYGWFILRASNRLQLCIHKY